MQGAFAFLLLKFQMLDEQQASSKTSKTHHRCGLKPIILRIQAAQETTMPECHKNQTSFDLGSCKDLFWLPQPCSRLSGRAATRKTTRKRSIHVTQVACRIVAPPSFRFVLQILILLQAGMTTLLQGLLNFLQPVLSLNVFFMSQQPWAGGVQVFSGKAPEGAWLHPGRLWPWVSLMSRP